MLLSDASESLVLGGEDAEVFFLALRSFEGFVCGEVRALVREHAGEHGARALQCDRAVVAGRGIWIKRGVIDHV